MISFSLGALPASTPCGSPVADGKRDGDRVFGQPGDTLLRVLSVWVMTLAFVSRAVRHIGN